MPGDAASAVPALRQALAAGVEERALARLARDPQITRRLEQFTRALEKAPDLKAALRDPRVLGVVLPALGLADGVSQPGLALRALTADPKDKAGLLARLPDRRWKSAAEALNLAERGIAALRDPKVQARLAEGLRRVTWQGELDAGQPGLSDAMLFRERAANAKTAYDVLGDPVLRRVVTGALGLPQQMAVQPVETQARAIASRVDIAKLQNPREVAKLAERYVVAAASSGSTAPTSWLAGLLA
ncbi:DUF1217 domain-containing protein [Siccirubricoccus sp. G192]|uniref:DUF1217 domain-containing protein n=1 Tax=Siccirubricoccus sp. G192 TaxID=2849651 RepID=UPI001C2C311A|nr:DUF1217 domain-containing protein [Siccirubricoccus sp. G192]MBV1797684.1 DUF1217 domain-containing protein [Siccirubricoccus sp. G192]